MSRLLLLRRTALHTHQNPLRQPFTTILSHPSSTPFDAPPSPPRLPPQEQAEFERLQRSSTGAFSTPTPSFTSSTSSTPKINQSPLPASSQPSHTPTQSSQASASSINTSPSSTNIAKGIKEEGELHPDVRTKPKPEFEGERNPKTGEIGGPKWEPVRWGSDGERGDWSFGGRVSDF